MESQHPRELVFRAVRGGATELESLPAHCGFSEEWRVAMACSSAIASSTAVVKKTMQCRGGRATSDGLEIRHTATLPTTRSAESELGHVLRRCLSSAFKGGIPGAMAGVLQVVTLMWLRTVVNYQYRYGKSIFAAAAELYSQGGISRFYRGVTFALVANPLSRFGMAAANEGALALCEVLPGPVSVTFSTWIASLFAGMWRIMLTPLDTCKTVLQVEGSKGFHQLMRKVLVCSLEVANGDGSSR